MNNTSLSSNAFSFRSVYTYNSSLNDDTLNTLNLESNHNYGYKYRQVPVDESCLTENIVQEDLLSKFVRKGIIFFSYLTFIVLFPVSICFCIKRIHALERLIVFRLGKMQPVISPGFCIVLPFIDKSIVVDLTPKIYSLPRQQIMTTDGGIVDISAEIKYCVCHVTCFVTRLYEQEDTIKELALRCFSNVVCGKEQCDVENDRESVASYIKAELNKTVVNWGIEILKVTICNVNVLKEAERVNPLDSVLNALTSATNTNAGSQILGSFFQPIQQSSCESQASSNTISDIQTPLVKFDDDDALIEKLKSIANEMAKRMKSPISISSIIKFKIIGEGEYYRNIFISFQEGNGVVFESENDSFEPNLTLTLSTNVMDDLLNLEISPMQAYVKGQIQISGDWNLLEAFENLNIPTL